MAKNVSGSLSKLVSDAMAATARYMSLMLAQAVTIDDLAIRHRALPEIVAGFASEDAMVLGVRIDVAGSGDGYLALVYVHGSAHALVDVLTLQPSGTTTSTGALELSVLREFAGIIVAAHFEELRDDATVLGASPVAFGGEASELRDLLGDADARDVEGLSASMTFRVGGRGVGLSFVVIANRAMLESLAHQSRAA